MPKSTIRIPGLEWDVPTSNPQDIGNIDDYLGYLFNNHKFTRGSETSVPSYIRGDYDLYTVLENRIKRIEGSTVHHGVQYPSVESLGLTSSFYPLTNAPTFLFYYSLTQIAPTHYPYLDNRIIDLALSMPRRYQLNKNLANRSLKRTNPDLADIPHAETGLPLKYPEIVHTAADLLDAFSDKIGWSSDDGGAWSDHDTVIRNSDIVPQYLLNNGPDCWDEIDPEQVRTIYENHLQGDNHYFALYGLLSLCNSYPFDETDLEG